MTVDTSFTPEDLAFRDEVREFLSQAYDEELQARLASGEPKVYKQAVIDWQKRLYEKGWIAPNWPVCRSRSGGRWGNGGSLQPLPMPPAPLACTAPCPPPRRCVCVPN